MNSEKYGSLKRQRSKWTKQAQNTILFHYLGLDLGKPLILSPASFLTVKKYYIQTRKGRIKWNIYNKNNNNFKKHVKKE